MVRDSLQVGKVPLSGQWSQQITKLKSGNTPIIRRQVPALPLRNLSPRLCGSLHLLGSWAYTPIVDFLNDLRSYAVLFARDVIRMLDTYQVSNKWKQAQDLFHAFVRSGCKLGADDLDLVKYFQLREAWGSKQHEEAGSTELLFSTKPGKST